MENQLVNIGAGLQAKQLVVSCNAFDLAKAGAPEEEIRTALSPEIRAALPLAQRSIKQELAVGGPADEDGLVMALGRQIGLLKAGLAAEHKEDWIGIAADELTGFPPDMVMEALRDVRRSAKFEGDVIPAVLALVEPQIAERRTQLKTIDDLMVIAG